MSGTLGLQALLQRYATRPRCKSNSDAVDFNCHLRIRALRRPVTRKHLAVLRHSSGPRRVSCRAAGWLWCSRDAVPGSNISAPSSSSPGVSLVAPLDKFSYISAIALLLNDLGEHRTSPLFSAQA